MPKLEFIVETNIKELVDLIEQLKDLVNKINDFEIKVINHKKND